MKILCLKKKNTLIVKNLIS
uniref:Uncharacterized protein n=1 Tax=Anguilla anguilla TaxID=7936 RepID=A0A0E9TZG4_ANGAN